MEYFKFKCLDIAKNWRSKWFYMKDSKTGNQEYGIQSFSITQSAIKRRSWAHEIMPMEKAVVDHLMEKLRGILSQLDAKVLVLVTFFLRCQVQPLQARDHGLCMYTGPLDKTRFSREDYPAKELEQKL